MEIDNLITKNFTKILVLFSFITLSTFGQVSINDNMSSAMSSLALQSISVTVGGDFPVNGSFIASRTERVDQFITRLATEFKAEALRLSTDEQIMNIVAKNVNEFALRNIKIKRINGEEKIIDLRKFRLTGNFEDNPYLENDDVLIFPTLNLEKDFIEIIGAVNKQLKFEFVADDKLSDAIQFANGLSEAHGKITGVEISRLSDDGNSENITNYSIDENPNLMRGDRIKILSEENKIESYKVTILGEVKNPGEIFITKNNSSLSEAIEKAGGLSEDASLKFTEIFRRYNPAAELRKKALDISLGGQVLNQEDEEKVLKLGTTELLKMYRSADITLEDTLFFGIDNSLRVLEGFAKIDFSNGNKEKNLDFILKDKDIIMIPEAPTEVYVWGGIPNTGFYKYSENKSISEYIQEAGGYSEIAYGSDEIFLIKGKSREWIHVEESFKNEIEPGDFIYVKKDPPKSIGFYLSRIGAIASIVGTVATVVLLVNQIGK